MPTAPHPGEGSQDVGKTNPLEPGVTPEGFAPPQDQHPSQLGNLSWNEHTAQARPTPRGFATPW